MINQLKRLEENEHTYNALAFGYANTEYGLPVRVHIEKAVHKVTNI
ncbi:hypothetical protein [Ruminococcus albus]|nr:hypothetical protein [Ruminococcus albus]